MHGALRGQSALEKGELPHGKRREFLFLVLIEKRIMDVPNFSHGCLPSEQS